VVDQAREALRRDTADRLEALEQLLAAYRLGGRRASVAALDTLERTKDVPARLAAASVLSPAGPEEPRESPETPEEQWHRMRSIPRGAATPAPDSGLGECGFNEPHEPHEYVVGQNGRPVDLPCPGLAAPDSGAEERLRAAAQTLVHFAGRFSAGDIDIQRDDLQAAIDDVCSALSGGSVDP